MIYIKGKIGDFDFTSTEPLAIAIECGDRIPNAKKSGLTAKVSNWAWRQLCNNTVGAEFNEGGVYMILVDDEDEKDFEFCGFEEDVSAELDEYKKLREADLLGRRVWYLVREDCDAGDCAVDCDYCAHKEECVNRYHIGTEMIEFSKIDSNKHYLSYDEAKAALKKKAEED